MRLNHKKIARTLGVAESSFLFYIIFCVNLCMSILEAGGRFALMFLPIADTIHAWRYWDQSKHLRDHPAKIFFNKLYYGARPLASAIGAGLAIAGGILGQMILLQAGFGIMIGMGLIGVARNLLKINLNWDNPHKVNNNAIKVAIGVFIAAGFTLITFVSEMPFVAGLSLGNLGGLLAAAAAAFIFIATAPAALVNTPVKAKNEEALRATNESVFSLNYEHDYVQVPLTFSNIFSRNNANAQEPANEEQEPFLRDDNAEQQPQGAFTSP
jgi:hypothetical protein